MTPALWISLGVGAAIFAFVLVGQTGAVLLSRDAHSVWGMRFAVIGIASKRAFLAVGKRFAPVRLVAESMPDIDLPPGSSVTVAAKPGSAVTVEAKLDGGAAVKPGSPS